MINDPMARQHLEGRLTIDPANDLDGEVEECGLIYALGQIIGGRQTDV